MAKQRTKGEPIVFRLALHYDLEARQLAGDKPIHQFCEELVIERLEQIREEQSKPPKRETSAFLGSYGD